MSDGPAAAGGKSLTFRLVAAAATWITLALVVGGFLLVGLFREYAESQFERELTGYLERLTQVVELNEKGIPRVTGPVALPFESQASGYYWQVAVPGKRTMISPSLWDEELELPAPATGAAADKLRRYLISGPDGNTLQVLESITAFPGPRARGAKKPPDVQVRLAVAVDRSALDAAVGDFTWILVVSLGALGLGLIFAIVVQVRFGLKPLGRMREALADIRTGKAERMKGEYPAEVTPLIEDLNAVLGHNADIVNRARTHVGNLAHALKTPLSVLTNEAAGGQPSAETVAAQTRAMRRHVDHYLARARTAATSGVLGARTQVRETAEALARTLARIHVEKGLEINVKGGAYLAFRGERQDLEEILGNVMDNACKWARSEVVVRVGAESGALRITIDDDGPGLTDEEMAGAMRRGERIDEDTPGSGLGLSIVRDISALYGGGVALARSRLGGLQVVLMLPAAHFEPDATDGPEDDAL